LLHGKEDGYLVDGAQQSVLFSCLQEPRREGRIWWHGSQQQNEKKTQQLGIWRTKAERRDSLGVEADWEREEARWLREEQRWLREEDRWRREEARWTEERKAWVQESLAMAEEIKVVRKKRFFANFFAICTHSDKWWCNILQHSIKSKKDIPNTFHR
jgi:hypothetical protein